MSNENKISFLKKLRKKLLESKKEVQNRDEIVQFYEDSLKISNAADGMVLIIGDNFTIPPRKALRGTSHQVIVQEIFDELANNNRINPINFNDITGDFGEIIPQNYNYIFIRMASILNGPTIIYYPENCSEYQIEQLKEFNDKIKAFTMANAQSIEFEYNGRNDEQITNNLDELIIELDKKKKKTVL